MARKKKGKKITRSFGHVQEIIITAPSKRMIVKHGNIDMGDPIQTQEYFNADLDLSGEQIEGVFTAKRKTHILFPPRTTCKKVVGEGAMKCKVKGKKIPRKRTTRTDEEKRKRRRERRQRRKEEKKRKEGK